MICNRCVVICNRCVVICNRCVVICNRCVMICYRCDVICYRYVMICFSCPMLCYSLIAVLWFVTYWYNILQMCYDLLKFLMGEEKLTQEANYPRSEVGHLILFDRGKRLACMVNVLKFRILISFCS